ncbi:MAG TPA: enoyl-CoA hydratase-related protein, partial [Longimicrobiaceae bacterium]|nr:enoyl-CoA hydratase-related protein [Longimicrobiaceae bacterium]
GGVGLAAACDLVIAAPEARFSLPEVVLGVIPAVVTPFLLRRLPPGRAGALSLGSRTLGAAEAHALGLVDEVAADGVEAALERQLGRVFRSSPAALAAQKRHLDALSGGAALEAQAAAAVDRLLEVLADPEALEGARAFADGFAPAWFARPPRRAS